MDLRAFLPLFLTLPLSVPGQLSRGGQPAEWEYPAVERSGIPEVALHALEELELAPMPGVSGLRYGVQRSMDVDVMAMGRWDLLPDGSRMCRLVLRSPGAVMLSVQFDRWEPGPGAMVFLYNEDRSFFIGGFDQSNAAPDGSMATAVVPGEAVVIEYRLQGLVRPGELHVASVTHGLVDIFHFGAAGYLRDYYPGYESAACQINVNCPIAADWQQQKRSVVMFLRPDGHGCTGSLINNTATPGRPFVNMARHCYVATENQWVFYFNYESADCVGNQGPTNQTMTGATLRAQWTWDDLLLVELNNPVPASYQPFFAGWDRSGDTPQSTVVIEHPLYDVKKIAFNNDPSTSAVHADGVQMWRGNWDQGIVEAVASGSPLFDQNKRIVGHMFDGGQNCSNAATVPTDCAKLIASWDGTAPNTRLRDWLDPTNSVVTLDGFDPNAVPSVRVRLRMFLEGPFNTTSTLMNGTLRDLGLIPLGEPYTDLGYAHAGGGGGEATTSGVLAVTGNDAIVDWVVIELRDATDPATILATRSALLKRNGYVVDIDGTSDVLFQLDPGSYHIAVHHRNHLGVMTASPQPLSASATLINLSNGDVPWYGGDEAVKAVGGRFVLLAGDATGNGQLRYVGSSNDRDAILARVGGGDPIATVNGYHKEDVNLDGVVRYAGSANDRDVILQNIGGSTPSAWRNALLP